LKLIGPKKPALAAISWRWFFAFGPLRFLWVPFFVHRRFPSGATRWQLALAHGN
jgi:hypothetical protein